MEHGMNGDSVMTILPVSGDAVSAPIAPYLSKPVAPFAGKSRRRMAATGAKYYSECSIQGIPPKEADDAAKESQTHFQKWWLQHRFSDDSSETAETPAGEDMMEMGSCKRKRRRSLTESVVEKKAKKDMKAAAASLGSNNKNKNGNNGSGTTTNTVSEDDEENNNYKSNSPSSTSSSSSAPFHQSGGASTAPEVSSSAYPYKLPDDIESTEQLLSEAKNELLVALTENDGETSGLRFLTALDKLKDLYRMTDIDVRHSAGELENCLDGVWLTMSKPNFHECLGKTVNEEYKYTLGRMSFDMFRPTDLVCSIQGVFNPVFVTKTVPDAVPRSLKKEIQTRSTTLRTYNIVVAFTIEPQDDQEVPRKPLQGVMTTYGYLLPDPLVPNRLSVWFTGGVLEANDETDSDDWAKVFGGDLPKRVLKERARLLAARLLLGASAPEYMDEDGSMSYYLKRPIGGHGVIYCDVLYLDDSLRIMQGQHGTIYVMTRVPPSPETE